MMVFMEVRVFGLNRHYAAVGDFAFHVLELNRRMVDVEPNLECGVDGLQDPSTLRRRNVGNRYVA
jgi:hypothetical protein